MANLIRGLSENGGVVFCGVDSTQIVRKAEKQHCGRRQQDGMKYLFCHDRFASKR